MKKTKFALLCLLATLFIGSASCGTPSPNTIETILAASDQKNCETNCDKIYSSLPSNNPNDPVGFCQKYIDLPDTEIKGSGDFSLGDYCDNQKIICRFDCYVKFN